MVHTVALVVLGALSLDRALPSAGDGVLADGVSLGARMSVEGAHAQGPIGALDARAVFGFAPNFELGADVQGVAGLAESSFGRNVPALADLGVITRWKLRQSGTFMLAATGRLGVTLASVWPSTGGGATFGIQAVVAPSDQLIVAVGVTGTLLMDAALIRYEGPFAQPMGGFGTQPFFAMGGGPDAAITWSIGHGVGLTASARVLFLAPYGTVRTNVSLSVGPTFAL